MKINQNLKHKYTKPTFTTVVLQPHSHLLQVSGNRGYDPDDENPFAPNP